MGYPVRGMHRIFLKGLRMESMTKQETYLQQRWQSQRDYYSKQSVRNKRLHQGLQLFIALGAIAAPIILNIPEVPKLVPAFISSLVAGAVALENVYRFGDNWRNFRQTLEALKRERALFDTEGRRWSISKS